MTKEKDIELSEQEIQRAKRIQHSMALEGHHITIEELIEVKKKSLANGDEEKIEEIVSKAKQEGISQLEAARKYFFNKEAASDE